MDWRRSYHEMQEAHADQLRLWAKHHTDVHFEIDGYSLRPYQLDEGQIKRIAREEAQKDLQRAINEWNASADRRAQR